MEFSDDCNVAKTAAPPWHCKRGGGCWGWGVAAGRQATAVRVQQQQQHCKRGWLCMREGGGQGVCVRAAEAGHCAERALRCSTANIGRAAGFGCSEPMCALHCAVGIIIIRVVLIKLFRF